MRRLGTVCWMAGLLLTGVMGGCGAEEDEDAGSGGGEAWPILPEEVIEEMTALSLEEILEATEDGCFASAKGDLDSAGATWTGAGVTRGNGLEVFWSAHVGVDGRDVSALQICEAESCRCVLAETTPSSVLVTPLSGDDSSLPVVGAPVLAKSFLGNDLGASTTLAVMEGALITEEVSGLDPARFQGKRRFVIANAYGPEFGMEFSGISNAAVASGRFTEVAEEPRIGASRVDEILRDFHAQDVLVWAGAAVRQDKGGAGFKPEGMTVNAGVYGDVTYDRERIEQQLLAAPLGGPGLIVLLGSETFGTAAEGLTPWGSVANLIQGLEARPRAIVGIRGMASAVDTLSSAAVLTDTLLDGGSLAEALAQANQAFTSSASPATWVTNLDGVDAETWVMAPAMTSFWGDASPTTGQFVGEVLITSATQCTDASGNLAAAVEKKVQFFADVEVDGPYFRGEKALGDVDFEVFGVIGGLHPGGAVRFWVTGSHGDVQNVVVLGDGRFCSTGECVGDVTGAGDFKPGGKLYFGGSAEATSYDDGQGGVCKPSALFLNQKGGKPGWLVINP